MIVNKIFRALKDVTGPFDIKLKKGDELHIVTDVVYCQGFPLPFEMQTKVYEWLINNNDFKDDTRPF